MTPSDSPPTSPSSSEAHLALMAYGRGRTGPIPALSIVDHVLQLTPDASWPVHRAALEAIVRRVGFMERDQLRVSAVPDGGRVLGGYATARPRKAKGPRGDRPYRTVLEAVRPFIVRCDCADYAKSALGLCKHGLAVLSYVYAKPRRLARGTNEQARTAPASRLRWNPVRPLTGPGDWLERITWHSVGSTPAMHTRMAKIFGVATEGVAHLRSRDLEDVRNRSILVDALLELSKRSRPGSADPALHALLVEERERLRRRVADRELIKGLSRRLGELDRKLYPYQIEGVTRFVANGRLLLADDMGLGKTVQAIAACHVLWRAGRVRRGLIVTPASLKPQWLREWNATTQAPAWILEGTAEERKAALLAKADGFLIANYEQVARDPSWFQAFGPDLVVLDEAQRIKNWSTKTALAIKLLDAPYRLALSGTPLENRLEELASLLDVIDDRALEPKWRLGPVHLTFEGNGDTKGVRTVAALDTLRARIGPHLLRRLRSEVLEQLPARRDTRVPVPMTEQQASEHDELNLPIARLVGVTKRRPLTREEFLRLMSLLTRQRMISNGLALVNFEATWPMLLAARPTPEILEGLFSPKLIELKELIRNLAVEQGRKVVVFSQWRRMLRLAHWAVSDVLDDAGLRAVFFTGAERQSQREKSVVELHDDPRTRVMFLTDAGGVGLNLQRAASACVHLELPWNPAVLEQRIGRIHRLGQKQKIDVHYLAAETGIESRIAALVGQKQALFKGLFDGDSDEIVFDEQSSFFARLETIIAPSGASRTPDPVEIDEEEREALDLATPSRTDEPTVPDPDEASDRETSASVADLLRTLEVRQSPDGSITLKAPKESATALASLFESMASMLRASAP